MPDRIANVVLVKRESVRFSAGILSKSSHPSLAPTKASGNEKTIDTATAIRLKLINASFPE